jgi:ribosomal protein S18 acetylase RimI-like enzyme
MNREATREDVPRLTALFRENLAANPGYISHGEIQMGIAAGPGRPAPDGIGKWEKYLIDKIDDPRSRVLLHAPDGIPIAFIIIEIARDGDRPFGVICDLLVHPSLRGRGIGDGLLAAGMNWLRDRGIDAFYLESGAGNASAHAFFHRRGFRVISHVFKWEPPADGTPAQGRSSRTNAR